MLTPENSKSWHSISEVKWMGDKGAFLLKGRRYLSEGPDLHSYSETCLELGGGRSREIIHLRPVSRVDEPVSSEAEGELAEQEKATTPTSEFVFLEQYYIKDFHKQIKFLAATNEVAIELDDELRTALQNTGHG